MPDLVNHTYTFSSVQIGTLVLILLFIAWRVVMGLTRAHEKITEADLLLSASVRARNEAEELRIPLADLSQSLLEIRTQLNGDIETEEDALDREVQESLGLLSYEDARRIERDQEDTTLTRDAVHALRMWVVDAEQEVRIISDTLEQRRRVILD